LPLNEHVVRLVGLLALLAAMSGCVHGPDELGRARIGTPPALASHRPDRREEPPRQQPAQFQPSSAASPEPSASDPPRASLDESRPSDPGRPIPDPEPFSVFEQAFSQTVANFRHPPQPSLPATAPVGEIIDDISEQRAERVAAQEAQRASAADRIIAEGVAGYRFGMTASEARGSCRQQGGTWSDEGENRAYSCDGARVEIEGVAIQTARLQLEFQDGRLSAMSAVAPDSLQRYCPIVRSRWEERFGPADATRGEPQQGRFDHWNVASRGLRFGLVSLLGARPECYPSR
jgi:hypothetical protein